MTYQSYALLAYPDYAPDTLLPRKPPFGQKPPTRYCYDETAELRTAEEWDEIRRKIIARYGPLEEIEEDDSP